MCLLWSCEVPFVPFHWNGYFIISLAGLFIQTVALFVSLVLLLARATMMLDEDG